MLIAQITDTHIALDTPDADQRIGDFAAVVADINALDPAPDLIVHTGDIVHNGRADEYAAACAVLAGAKTPVCVMAGNKDDRDNLREAFAVDGYLNASPEFIAYEVDGGPVRLLMLDTVSTATNKGDFCDRRLAALADMIGAADPRPIVVFAHHPPFEVLVGPERFHFENPDAMTRFRGVLGQSGRVTAIICGHVHRPTSGEAEGIPVAVATAVATTLRKGAYPAEAEGRPIYCLHHVGVDGRLMTETRIAG